MRLIILTGYRMIMVTFFKSQRSLSRTIRVETAHYCHLTLRLHVQADPASRLSIFTCFSAGVDESTRKQLIDIHRDSFSDSLIIVKALFQRTSSFEEGDVYTLYVDDCLLNSQITREFTVVALSAQRSYAQANYWR